MNYFAKQKPRTLSASELAKIVVSQIPCINASGRRDRKDLFRMFVHVFVVWEATQRCVIQDKPASCELARESENKVLSALFKICGSAPALSYEV